MVVVVVVAAAAAVVVVQQLAAAGVAAPPRVGPAVERLVVAFERLLAERAVSPVVVVAPPGEQ